MLVKAAVWGGMAHQNDREIALHIKHAFDSLYGGGKWHVVVGTSIGSVVSHEKDSAFGWDSTPHAPPARGMSCRMV